MLALLQTIIVRKKAVPVVKTLVTAVIHVHVYEMYNTN